jgi:subtilisin family serine protease
MVITFTLAPKTLLAATENDNSKPQTIYLKGAELNVEEVSEVKSSVEDMNYIIAFNGPIDENMKEEVIELGVELVEYIPDFSYLSRLSSKIIPDVVELPFVEEVIVYQPEYKINPLLEQNRINSVRDNGKVEVRIATFDDPSVLDEYIEKIEGIIVDTTKDEVIVEMNRNDIEQLAELSSVKYIEPMVERVLFNDVARGYMGVNNLALTGYEGQGQVVCVCDTGIDTGVNNSNMHKDFQGRIDAIYPLGRSTADDVHGHGTHVSGSVLGSGDRSNGQITGIAPEAHLVMQSVLDSGGGLGGLPNDLNTLFQQGSNAGARIHTNSWGAAVGGQYTADSQDVDEYVWNNDDMIILFSAGNSGDGYSGTQYNSIGAPGTAKNCITVGATENNRPSKGTAGDNPDEIAYFSSRGDCDDGRTKPDIVAPGTWILSTKSSVAPVSNYWEDYDTYYAYMGGTSMSTPLTAGAVAVAREYMVDEWNHTPSAAMMKAAIINGGTDLGFGFPSRDQGWGRISLEDSLRSKEYEYVDQDYSLATNQTKNFTYAVESTNTPLRVTLVWSDYPGSTSASKALVNDLDVKITSPSGTVYYGNDFSQPYDTSYDRVNNVENIYINNPEIGNYTVEVKGYNVPQGPQPFALFSSGDFGTAAVDDEDPTCSITSPNNGATVDGMLTINANATDNVAVEKVEFYVDNNKIGEDNQAPYSYDFNTASVNNGSHDLKVKAIDTSANVGTSNVIAVTVNNITDTEDPTCSITSPNNGATVDGTITINADATDDVAVAKVEFYVDNNKIGEDTNAPYTYDWDTTSVSNADHNLKVKAIDTSNKEGLSNEITVTVDNTTTVGYVTETYTGTASIFGNAQVDLNVTAPGTIDLEISGSNTSLRMKLYDPNNNQIGNSKTSISYDATETGTYSIVISAFSFFDTDFTLTATYPVESTQSFEIDKLDAAVVELPDLAVSEENAFNEGDIINDVISINTNADENTTIEFVELYIDDNKVNEYSGVPEVIEWDTTTVDNGEHTIQIKVIDEDGNVIPSIVMNIIVENIIE